MFPIRLRALLPALLCSLAASAWASPATDLYRAATRTLQANYYGWSEADRAGLVADYARRLEQDCVPRAESCPFDQGRAVLKELLEQMHDPHTNVRDAEGAERLREVQQDLTVPRSGVRVKETPAGLLVVGVQRFDLIHEVNGRPAGEGQAQDAAAFVRLERAAAPIQVRLERGGRALALTLTTLPLKARDLPTLTYQQGPSGTVAVILYPSFLPQGSAARFLELLRQAQAAGARGLVVDLRYNGGGQLDECVKAASIFEPVLYQARWEGGSWEYAALNGEATLPLTAKLSRPTEGLWHGPSALLIGENTASCAEVFGHFARGAGALLVGETTKGVMNSGVNFFPLPDHGVLSVTVLRAYDRFGAPLPSALTPDLTVHQDAAALAGSGRDEVMAAALGQVGLRLAAAER